MFCSIVSVTSYLSGIEAKNLQNGDVHIAQIPDFEMEYLENHLTHWGRRWLVFCIFHALSFELNFFRPEVPFKSGVGHFSAVSLSANRRWPTPILGELSFWCQYKIINVFLRLHQSLCDSLRFRLRFDNPRAD